MSALTKFWIILAFLLTTGMYGFKYVYDVPASFMILLATIQAVLLAVIEAHEDAQKETIKHWTSIYRLPIIGGIIFYTLPVNVAIYLTLYSLGVFWIAFDQMYNYWRGQHYYYIGNTAYLDKLARRIKLDPFDRWFSFVSIKVVLVHLFATLFAIAYDSI